MFVATETIKTDKDKYLEWLLEGIERAKKSNNASTNKTKDKKKCLSWECVWE